MIGNKEYMEIKEDIQEDTKTIIGDSIIQHGKYNNRIYLMKLLEKDFPDIIQILDQIAQDKKYTKIFAKVPEFARYEFTKNGYITEAYIPKFFSNQKDVYFMGKYFSKLRMYNGKIKEINDILDMAISKNKNTNFNIPIEFDFKILNKSHILQISSLYKKVFETYPFPIYDPKYISETMDENFIYFGIFLNHYTEPYNTNLVAISSTEMDIDSQNVEMTDFATLPEYRKNNFATYLLNEMENEMRNKEMKMAYTITRATCIGINIIFARMGYKYGGLLLNNTNISGGLESMNVWYKEL